MAPCHHPRPWQGGYPLTYFPAECSPEHGYLVSEVQDDEGGVGHARLLEVLAGGVAVVQLLRPLLVRALGHLHGDKGDSARARWCSMPMFFCDKHTGTAFAAGNTQILVQFQQPEGLLQEKQQKRQNKPTKRTKQTNKKNKPKQTTTTKKNTLKQDKNKTPNHTKPNQHPEIKQKQELQTKPKPNK